MGDGSSLGLDPLKESGPFFRQVLKGLQGSEKEIDRPLRIYEHKNGIYSVHGNSDIELVASCNLENLHSVEQIQIRNLQVVPTLRLNYRLVSDLIAAALSSAGRKVELWSRSGGSASIKASGSPARHDELDDFLEHNTRATTNGDSAIVAVKMGTIDGNRVLGVAACQSGGLHLSIGEFNDDEFFSQLESIIVSVGAREVLFCTNDASDYDESKISEVLAKCGAARTKLKKSDFSAEFIEIDMRTLVGASLEAVQFLDAKLGMGALASLIRYLGLLEQSSLEGNVRLNRLDNDSFMKLDAAALAALNVFPKPGETGPSSLYGLLNKTKTSMGARLLRRWMSQPLQDKKLMETRLDLVDAFLLDPTMRTRLRDEHLKRIPDLSSICRKFQKKPISASLQDVVKLYQFSARLPFLRTVISEHEDANCQAKITDRFGKVLQELSSELANFEALVETTIDLDELDNYEFVINPTIDEVLMELKEKKDEILSDISETYEATRDALGMDSEKLKLEKKDGLGYYYRLTRKDEKLIRDRKAFLVIETRKDGVRFTNKDLRRLSSQYYELAEEYNTKQSELKKKTLEVVSTYLPVFEDCVISVAELDVLVSFACAAADAPEMYTRPTILAPGDGLQIDSGRHPMVEECLDGKPFISNDIKLVATKERDGAAMSIITGPNMGGKSTYIRTAGVIVLMAHIGCFVPAQRADIPVTDRILARVGAGDNQLRGVSTFMAEMLETAAILRSATSRSLIIIDELGRGTSTYDGFGLAYAISEHIVTKIRASCLFATHFHELTSLSNVCENVQNLHVTATNDSEGKLVFLYEVRDGPCDESFGIHVAEMAGFPARVVQAAKRKAHELEEVEHGPEAEKLAGARKQVRAFLKEFKALKMDNMTPSEAISSVRQLRDRLVPEDNPYLQSMPTC